MYKFKILKQRYTPADTEIPETVKERVWVGKLTDEDTVDIFVYRSDAEHYMNELLQIDTSGRKYKIVEI